MKQIFITASAICAAASTKVSAEFVNQVKEAFLMFPMSVTMRIKQNEAGQLVISLMVTYKNGMKQHLEGAADVDLISAIITAMGRINSHWAEYEQQEHEIEVATEGTNLVKETFGQFWASTMQRIIESDWYSNTGKRYRRITFSPAYHMHIKFCLEATDELNAMIAEACKSENMERAAEEDVA